MDIRVLLFIQVYHDHSYICCSSKQNSLFLLILNSCWFLGEKIIRKRCMSLTLTNWKVRTMMIFRCMAMIYTIYKLMIYVKTGPWATSLTCASVPNLTVISWKTFAKIADLHYENRGTQSKKKGKEYQHDKIAWGDACTFIYMMLNVKVA